MISAEYLQTGVICKLREGFRSIGLTAQWNERDNCGNPAMSRQVTRYFKMVQEQQAKAGVSQRQAAIFLGNQLQDFLRWLAVLLLMPECQDDISQFEIRMLCSFVSSAFASSKRCDDVCWILTRKIFRIPNSAGLIVNFQFGKTLRQLPNHMFLVLLQGNLVPVVLPCALNGGLCPVWIFTWNGHVGGIPIY